MILLSDCVAQVESSGNPLAMRYEPDYTPTLNSIQLTQKFAANGYMDTNTANGYMDTNTARMIASTSWGKFQIMGANLYAVLKYEDTLVSFLSDVGSQLAAFQSFIGHIGFTDGPFSLMSENALLRFARLYNGSEVYAESLKHAYGQMDILP